MFFEAWLDHWAAKTPTKPALITASQRLNWADLWERAQSVAAQLQENCIRKGERVALLMDANWECVTALNACMLAGIVAVPVDMRLTESERLEQTRGTRLTIDEDFVQTAIGSSTVPAYQPASPLLGDTALAVHTSGTTGQPHPVELTYGNIRASAAGSIEAMNLQPDECWLCPMPLIHIGGIMVIMRSLILGSTVVLTSPKFKPEEIVKLLKSERVTAVSLVPTMLDRLLAVGLQNPTHLRLALVGGAPISQQLLDDAVSAGIPVVQTYGLTQACSQVTVTKNLVTNKARAISKLNFNVGYPLPGVEVKLQADGEILVRGPNVAPKELSVDGYLHTGDLGEIANGELRISGRKADTIITGGENVSPVQIEDVLQQHPAIEDAAVFSMTDSQWGEAIAAKVVLASPCSTEEITNYCRHHLARYKVPKTIAIVDKLPRTSSGKLLRRKLNS